MSPRGNCHDNAVAESFFNLLKRERIRRKTYRTRDEARQDVFDYIEIFYNPTRKHATGCCHPSSSKGSTKSKPRASRRLGAAQVGLGILRLAPPDNVRLYLVDCASRCVATDRITVFP